MKMLNGDAVAYIAKGTYSSIIRLVAQRETPHPNPEISLLTSSTQTFINCVVTAPTVKITPFMSRVLRLPMFKILLVDKAPAHAPIL